jgi:hypothetical protein
VLNLILNAVEAMSTVEAGPLKMVRIDARPQIAGAGCGPKRMNLAAPYVS